MSIVVMIYLFANRHENKNNYYQGLILIKYTNITMADTPTCLVEMCVLETTHSFFGKKSNEKENNDYQYL